MKCRIHILFLILITGLMLLTESCKTFHFKKEKRTENAFNANDFSNLFIDGCTQFAIYNYTLAVKIFSKCSDLKPDEASVYYYLSRSYERNNDPNRCLLNAMKASNLEDSNFYYSLWYSEQLRKNGNSSEAIKVLEKSFTLHPKDEILVKALDQLYSFSPDLLQKRIGLWSKLHSVSSYKLSTSLKLIELYKLNKDFVSAHAVYKEIQKASPGKYQYFIDDANLYLEENDEKNAMINFDKALEINPNNFQLNTSLFKLQAGRKNEIVASGYIKKAFSDPLTDVNTKLAFCAELNRFFIHDSAYELYVQTVALELTRLYPDNSNALYTAAQYFEISNHYSSAIENYKKVCLDQPGNYGSWMALLRLCDKLKLPEEKIAFANQALEYYPNVAAIYLEAAKTCNTIEKYTQAINYCHSGMSFAFDPMQTFGLLKEEGLANFHLGNFKDAETIWIKASAINQSDFELYDYLGNVYSRLDQKEKAIENWKKARDLGLKSETLELKIKNGKYVE